MTRAPHASATRTGEEREQLEGERDFLLQSLDDLESERAAGNIDAESYAQLHDDYTARAAAAIRALRDGVDARPVTPPAPWGRRAAVIAAIVAFAVASAIALAAALGARLPGETSSGNTRSSGARVEDTRKRLERAVAGNPNDAKARIAFARFLEESNEPVEALKQYDEAARRDPKNAEALANAGRLRYLTAGQVPDARAQSQLLAGARDQLDRAVQVDPTYVDAHFFRGVLLVNPPYRETATAVAEFQRYLALAPNGQFAEQARRALAEAGAPTPAGTVPSSRP